MNIIIAHIQGGEITGSIDESVRHSVTKLSHIHLACTNESKKRIIQMGENKQNVFNVGCPSIDILKKKFLKKKIDINNYGTGDKINLNKKFILVIFHPVTTSIDNQKYQIDSLISCIEKLNLQTIWLWPNIDAGSNIISKKLRLYQSRKKIRKLRLVTSLEVEVYNTLLSKTSCAIGNSSSFIREGSYLGTPAVIIGERQNKREHGQNIKFVKIKENLIINAVKKQIKHGKYKKSEIYGNGNASKIMEKILLTSKPKIQKVFSD
jgi:UDP-hydrolysing UDP-N-acetyl-D-glucosamine 2-epimerase